MNEIRFCTALLSAVHISLFSLYEKPLGGDGPPV